MSRGKLCSTATLAVVFVMGAAAAGAHHRGPHVPGCKTRHCDRVIGRLWARKQARLRYRALLRSGGPWQGPVTFTHYSGPCDNQTQIMADGTTIHEPGGELSVGDDHAIASTFLPQGATILFERPVYGSRQWTVRDSGGYADLYVPDCQYTQRGWPGDANPPLRYRILN